MKAYVLVEQLEACYQLMEIRAALGRRFVGFNTGRWDYINSVADAIAWDQRFSQPQHRRRYHEIRLHAHLRGPGAARGRHAPAEGQLRALAGRHAAQHPGRLGKGHRHWNEARARRRRERAEGRRQRQVGGALEDGPHRPAHLGEGRRRQPAGPRFPAADLQSAGRGRPGAARARTAHGARGPRPALDRAAIRQRLRSRLPARRRRSSRPTTSATPTNST